MSHSKITLQHPHTKNTVVAPIGFSWSVLFLGFFVPFWRCDWFLGILMLLLTPLWPLANLVMCWSYNKHYLQKMIKAGYLVAVIDSDFTADALSRQVGVPLGRVQLNG